MAEKLLLVTPASHTICELLSFKTGICLLFLFVSLRFAGYPSPPPGVDIFCQPGAPPMHLSSLSPDPGWKLWKGVKANHYIYI